MNGEMAERLNAPVLKTGGAKASGGSNPSLSANGGIVQPGEHLPCTQAAGGSSPPASTTQRGQRLADIRPLEKRIEDLERQVREMAVLVFPAGEGKVG